MNKKAIFIILFSLVFSNLAYAQKAFNIKLVNKTWGTISFELSFKFEEPKTIYSWGGDIYPILGSALFSGGKVTPFHFAKV